jgi:hypothetical protein
MLPMRSHKREMHRRSWASEDLEEIEAVFGVDAISLLPQPRTAMHLRGTRRFSLDTGDLLSELMSVPGVPRRTKQPDARDILRRSASKMDAINHILPESVASARSVVKLDPSRPLWRVWYARWQSGCHLQPEPVPISSQDTRQPRRLDGSTARRPHR